MNDYQLTQENISLTRNWTYKDWKKFRSEYEYWETKDRLISSGEFYRFKKFKNNCLRNYLKNY